MRVLMVTDFYEPLLGGVEQHVRTLAHQLCRRDHEVIVATLRVDGTAAHEWDGAVEVVRIRSTTQRVPRLFDQSRPWAPPVPDPGAALALRRLITRRRPDVVHGHDWLARSLLPMPAAGPPLVVSLHYYTRTCAKKTLLRGDRPCGGPSLRRCLGCAREHYGALKGVTTATATVVGRHLEQRSTARFIAVSSATAHGNGLDAADPSCVVVPNFVDDRASTVGARSTDVDTFLARLPDAEFFAYVGDFRSVKGFDVLLDAYERLGTERPLVAIGKRWPTSPERTPPGVWCFERWPNDAVRAALGRARALVVPSVWMEPFGIVAIEAMAAGTPVIASATGGLVDIVDHRRTGLLVEPGAADPLREAMAELDGDDRLCSVLGHAASEAAARYRTDAVVPQIEAIYDSVVHERGVAT